VLEREFAAGKSPCDTSRNENSPPEDFSKILFEIAKAIDVIDHEII